MRVVTFNVQHGRRPDGVVDVALLARTCAALRPDVLALQEVDRFARRSRRADLAFEVAAATGLAYAFGRAHRLGIVGQYGNALLAPSLDEIERLRLPGRGEPRAALLARAGGLSVATAHLSRDRLVSAAQLDAVLERLEHRPLPRLFLGDCNRRAHEVGLLAERGWTVAGGPPTYPAHDPTLRIDHVAVQGLEILSVDAPAAPLSDHRPLIVEVEAVR